MEKAGPVLRRHHTQSPSQYPIRMGRGDSSHQTHGENEAERERREAAEAVRVGLPRTLVRVGADESKI
eukprot:6200588-Pleurochrysis_carterae.AAC.3